MSTCLITGAAGFIGSHIAEELVRRGNRVICIDNMVNGKMDNLRGWWDEKLCTFVNADVSRYSMIRQHFLGVDYVFHNAASKCTVCTQDPEKDLLVNALGTLNVCSCAREMRVKKVIHASTGSVNEVNSYYGNSKRAGEEYVRLYKRYHPEFNYSVLRYHHVYGPRQDNSDKGGVVPIFIRNISLNKPITIFGDGNQTRHFTYVKDIVDANIFCMEEPLTDGGTYNLIPDHSTTINELAGLLGRFMGRDIRIEYAPEKPGDIKHFGATSSEIRALGYKFKTNLSAGLSDTIRWYLSDERVAA